MESTYTFGQHIPVATLKISRQSLLQSRSEEFNKTQPVAQPTELWRAIEQNKKEQCWLGDAAEASVGETRDSEALQWLLGDHMFPI